MKRPFPRNSAVDENRIAEWLILFSQYTHSVTTGIIERWLQQFTPRDRDIAARVLDCVHFITNEQILSSFKSTLESLPGWDKDEKRRNGKWRFVPFTASSGESGDSMIHRFRRANNLNFKKYNSLFIYKSDLLLENLNKDDTVVFIDDFSGTGEQAETTWNENLQELLPNEPNIYLVLIATSVIGRTRIENFTKLRVSSSVELTDEDNMFSSHCRHFSSHEKNIIIQYCRKANNLEPKGRGNCGFVIVFAHDCPNNSIPILHAYHNRWRSMFRRNY